MSDAQQINWAEFHVSNDGQYGGGSDLNHHRGRCDWRVGIDDLNPLEISGLAVAHAATCTGEPRLRPVPGPKSALGETVQSLWGAQIEATLRRPLFFNRVSAPGTGAGDA